MELKSHGIGIVCAEPEYKVLNNDNAVCNLRLVFNRNYKSNGGEWIQEPTYMRATVWGKIAERAGQLKVGTSVFVDGYVSSDSWEDKDGVKRVSYLLNVRNFEVCEKNGNGDKKQEKDVVSGGKAKVSPKTKTAKKPTPVEPEIPENVDDDEDLEVDDEELPF